MHLVRTTQDLLRQVSRDRRVDFEHVDSHTGVAGNERADRLADRGAWGEIGPQSCRWKAPAPEAVREGNVDYCRKCGMEFKDFNLRRVSSHEIACFAPRAVPSTIQCRKCGIWLQGWRTDRGKHEKRCRGSDLANRTCVTCGRVLDTVVGRSMH